MQTKDPAKSRFGLRFLLGYAAVNLILFFSEPYGSPWHYQSHTPTPIETIAPTDTALTLDEIADILDSIDLAYKAREPNLHEKLWLAGEKLTQILFLPSSVALVMKSFVDYMGPSTPEQREFTLSVKRRYNHLAAIAVKKGMNEDGFLYLVEPSFSKKNGPAYSSMR